MVLRSLEEEARPDRAPEDADAAAESPPTELAGLPVGYVWGGRTKHVLQPGRPDACCGVRARVDTRDWTGWLRNASALSLLRLCRNCGRINDLL